MALGTYSGTEKLCFGLDIGTTMTAVSFTHLKDGEEPRIRLVTRWPGQEDAAGDCKVPTIIRYTNDGLPAQYGTEAVENIEGIENTTLAKWFKLHLHPATMRSKYHLTPPPLPRGVALKEVYADFLGYVFKHAREYVDKSSLDAVGRGSLWTRLKGSCVVVMAIPNGWDNTQQAFLRDAVVSAGILPFNHDRERLKFVSESEASVHFAIAYANIGSWLRKGTTLAVCDAGGSTVDTTVYRCTSTSPQLQLEEVTSSECVQAGSAFLDQEAELFLERKLVGTKYGTPEMINLMVREFERKTKRKFDGTQDKSVIQFGHSYDNDRPRVSQGRLSLTCDEVKSLFERPLDNIATSLDSVLSRSGGFEAMVLVGGFAESQYLQRVLLSRLKKGTKQINIDEATNKAAAEGALAWYTKQFVVARAARATYGIEIGRIYNKHLPAHACRSHLKYVDCDGQVKLGGVFSPLVHKNEIVQNDLSNTSRFRRNFSSFPTSLSSFETTLLSVDDPLPGSWCRNTDGSIIDEYRTLCTLKADLSGLERSLRSAIGLRGKQYWCVNFGIEVFFGQTSLCANLVWTENGQTRKGPVSVISNSII